MKKGYVFIFSGACALVVLSQLALSNWQFVHKGFSATEVFDARKSENVDSKNFTVLPSNVPHSSKDGVVLDLTAPLTCDQNLSDYVYFNVGTEQFKFSNRSLSGLEFGASTRDDAAFQGRSPLPSGCPDNPYIVTSRFLLVVDNNGRFVRFPDIGIDKFDSFYVEGVRAEDRGGVSDIQSSLEEKFEQCKSNGFEIDGLGAGLFQCSEAHAKNIRGAGSSQIIFMSSPDRYATQTGRPLVVACHKSKESMTCFTHYRLLPSIDVGYSFKSRNLKPEKIIELDLEIRKSIEEARVKSS